MASGPSADLADLAINCSSAPPFPRRRGMSEKVLLWAQEEEGDDDDDDDDDDGMGRNGEQSAFGREHSGSMQEDDSDGYYSDYYQRRPTTATAPDMMMMMAAAATSAMREGNDGDDVGDDDKEDHEDDAGSLRYNQQQRQHQERQRQQQQQQQQQQQRFELQTQQLSSLHRSSSGLPFGASSLSSPFSHSPASAGMSMGMGMGIGVGIGAGMGMMASTSAATSANSSSLPSPSMVVTSTSTSNGGAGAGAGAGAAAGTTAAAHTRNVFFPSAPTPPPLAFGQQHTLFRDSGSGGSDGHALGTDDGEDRSSKAGPRHHPKLDASGKTLVASALSSSGSSSSSSASSTSSTSAVSTSTLTASLSLQVHPFTASFSGPSTPVNHSPPAALSPISPSSLSPLNEPEPSTAEPAKLSSLLAFNGAAALSSLSHRSSPWPPLLLSDLETPYLRQHRASTQPGHHHPGSYSDDEDDEDAANGARSSRHQRGEPVSTDFGSILLAAQQMAHTKLRDLRLDSPQVRDASAEAHPHPLRGPYSNDRKRTMSDNDWTDAVDDVIANLSLSNSGTGCGVWVCYTGFPESAGHEFVRDTLVDMFSAVGEIVDFYLPLSSEHVAFVCFSAPEEAQKAVSIFASPADHILDELMNSLSIRVHDGQVDGSLVYSQAFSAVGNINKVAVSTPRGLVLSKRARLSPTNSESSLASSSAPLGGKSGDPGVSARVNDKADDNGNDDDDDGNADGGAAARRAEHHHPQNAYSSPLSEYSLNLWHQSNNSRGILTVQQLSRMENMGIDISGFQVLLE